MKNQKSANTLSVGENVVNYLGWLQSLSKRYRSSQIKAAVAINSEMLRFYWSLGADIVRMEPEQKWGSKFMQRLSEDIRREIPGAGCFSRINLYYMRWFFELYCMRPIVPQLGEQLDSDEGRLELIVPQSGVRTPVEAYQDRFPNIARLLLSIPWGHHKVIIDKFKGREYLLDMGSEMRPLDMLFYNDDKHFYLVVEVKVRKFEPADVGQVNAYVAAVNHQLRKPSDGPTIGLIICKEKDRVTAKYSLEGVATPIGIADYALEKFLPTDFVSDLPEIESIEEDQTRRLQRLLSCRTRTIERPFDDKSVE